MNPLSTNQSLEQTWKDSTLPSPQDHRIIYYLEKTIRIKLNCQPDVPNFITKHTLSVIHTCLLNMSRVGDSTNFPRQTVPMLDHFFHEEILPSVQFKSSLVQLEMISSCSTTCHLRKEADNLFNAAFFQVAVDNYEVSVSSRLNSPRSLPLLMSLVF